MRTLLKEHRVSFVLAWMRYILSRRWSRAHHDDHTFWDFGIPNHHSIFISLSRFFTGSGSIGDRWLLLLCFFLPGFLTGPFSCWSVMLLSNSACHQLVPPRLSSHGLTGWTLENEKAARPIMLRSGCNLSNLVAHQPGSPYASWKKSAKNTPTSGRPSNIQFVQGAHPNGVSLTEKIRPFSSYERVHICNAASLVHLICFLELLLSIKFIQKILFQTRSTSAGDSR